MFAPESSAVACATVVVSAADAQAVAPPTARPAVGELWSFTDTNEPNWPAKVAALVRVSLAEDAEWIQQFNDGAITSPRRRETIQGWIDNPDARLAVHQAAAQATVDARIVRWRAAATSRLSAEHQQLVLKRGFNPDQLWWMFRAGLIRSLSWE
jgi:hypothetical protein